jgi:YggT family protein
MDAFTAGTDVVLAVLRTALLSIAVVFGAICILDWAVRARKISPFNAVARFCRSTVDPFIAPIERKVVRAGGTPASAPLWALTAVVVGGIILLSVVDFLRFQIYSMVTAMNAGSAGPFYLLVRWTFGILKIALLVRVVTSWLPVSPYSRWVSWSYGLSEPILGPLRRIVPNLGMLDITPILAYFLLGLIESLLFSLVR